jgi:hypothetical protein
MSDPDNLTTSDTLPTQDASARSEDSRGRGIVVWSAVSLGFLALLGFGSLEARIWRFNRLYFEDRKVLDVWSYEGRNLPDIAAQGFFSVLYYAAVAVLVLGTIYGLWLLLDEAGTGSRKHSSTTVNDSPEHA